MQTKTIVANQKASSAPDKRSRLKERGSLLSRAALVDSVLSSCADAKQTYASIGIGVIHPK